jgi:hypothetical protein
MNVRQRVNRARYAAVARKHRVLSEAIADMPRDSDEQATAFAVGATRDAVAKWVKRSGRSNCARFGLSGRRIRAHRRKATSTTVSPHRRRSVQDRAP